MIKMSLLNTKYMESHRLLHRNNRLLESKRLCQREGSQLFTQTYREEMCETNGFEDVIRFGDYQFTYDKQFLNNLRQFTKELRKGFSTEESRKKSRIYGLNGGQNLNEEKNDLIQRIRELIKEIDESSDEILDFTPETVSKCCQRTQPMTQPMSSNVFIRSDNCMEISDEYDSESDNECDDGYHSFENSSQYVVTPKEKLFTQQYIQSLDSQRFQYSDENKYRILSPSEVNTSYDSGYGSGSGLCSQPISVLRIENRHKFSQKNSEMCSQNSSQLFELKGNPLKIVNRHKWDNTEYNISTGITLIADPKNKVRVQRKRKTQLKFVLKKILNLIEEDVFCTKRDLYYQNVAIFDQSQRVVDEIIDDLASSLRVSRIKLRIVSSTRGLVFGHLMFENTNGVLTDCLSSPNGINIPNDTERINRMQSNALFVLIIEKDATFQQLIDLKIDRKFPLIMITGHGYPDMNTRAFVQMLWNTFEIPIYGLVDGDAHGLEILCTFRHGSLALSYESSSLVAPVIRWLGVLPTDIIEYELSPSVQIKLKETDIKKIKDLKNRKYLVGNYEWNRQLDILLTIGKKVEIQSLAEHWPTFLLDVYLPAKIRYGKWI